MSLAEKILKEAKYSPDAQFAIYDKDNNVVFQGNKDECNNWWGRKLYKDGPGQYELIEYKTERGQYWLALISHRGKELKVITKGHHQTVFNNWFNMLLKAPHGLIGYTAKQIDNI